MGLHALSDLALDQVHRQPQFLGDPGREERERLEAAQSHVEVTLVASALIALQVGVGDVLGALDRVLANVPDAGKRPERTGFRLAPLHYVQQRGDPVERILIPGPCICLKP